MPLKIMVVDEEPASMTLVRSLAAPLGHTALAFEDGRAAVERAKTQRFDVVFVGTRAAGADELEIVREIRESEPNRETMIVALSPSDTVADMRKAFAEGADLVVGKPLTGGRLRPMLAAMDSPGWKRQRHAARLPLFTEVICTWDERQFPLRSMNISQSGILLQGPLDAEVGQEVELAFKIAEVGASLNVVGRISRRDETDRVGVEFLGLTREDQNAIQLYVLGRLKDLTSPRDLSDVGMRRLFNPYH